MNTSTAFAFGLPMVGLVLKLAALRKLVVKSSFPLISRGIPT